MLEIVRACAAGTCLAAAASTVRYVQRKHRHHAWIRYHSGWVRGPSLVRSIHLIRSAGEIIRTDTIIPCIIDIIIVTVSQSVLRSHLRDLVVVVCNWERVVLPLFCRFEAWLPITAAPPTRLLDRRLWLARRSRWPSLSQFFYYYCCAHHVFVLSYCWYYYYC